MFTVELLVWKEINFSVSKNCLNLCVFAGLKVVLNFLVTFYSLFLMFPIIPDLVSGPIRESKQMASMDLNTELPIWFGWKKNDNFVRAFHMARLTL